MLGSSRVGLAVRRRVSRQASVFRAVFLYDLAMTVDVAARPLTILSEEEVMFRDAVAAFADEEVKPRVKAMEKASKIDPELIPKFFELGLMGIEIPEQYGG